MKRINLITRFGLVTVVLATLAMAVGPDLGSGLANAGPTAAPPAGVIISEVKPDPTGLGWVELYNTSSTLVDMAGMAVCANNICGSFSLPSSFGSNIIPNDAVIIAADAGKFRTAHPTFFGTIGQITNAAVINGLNPAGDTLTLHGAGDGKKLDTASWSTPGPTVGTTQTVQRDPDSGNWYIANETLAAMVKPAPGVAFTGPGPASGGSGAVVPAATVAAVGTPGGATASTLAALPTAVTAQAPAGALPPAGLPAVLPQRLPRRASLTPRGVVSIAIDTPEGGSTAQRIVRVAGWAAANSGQPVDKIWIAVDGDARGSGLWVGQATLGVDRPDLVAAYGEERFAKAGYEFSFDASRFRGAWRWITVFAHEAGQPDNAGWDVEAVDVYIGG